MHLSAGSMIMSRLSTGGPVSSRTFTKRIMEATLTQLPSSQRADVRKLSRLLDKRTGMGYYAAMNFLADLGIFIHKKEQNTS